MEKQSTWLSVHLYTASSWPELLAKGIFPFVKTLQTTWFYVNYVDDSGFHIRLRIKLNDEIIDQVKSQLTTHLSKIFDDILIIDSPYHPEISRYGGEAGLAISENYFHLSSETIARWILEVLEDGDTWTEADANFASVVIHILPLTHDAQVFEWLSNHWNLNKIDKKLLDEEILNQYDYILSPLLSWIKDINERDFIQQWILKSKKLFEQLSQTALLMDVDASINIPPATVVAASLFHMNNNRLGVHLFEEAHLAKLTSKLLANTTVQQLLS